MTVMLYHPKVTRGSRISVRQGFALLTMPS